MISDNDNLRPMQSVPACDVEAALLYMPEPSLDDMLLFALSGKATMTLAQLIRFVDDAALEHSEDDIERELERLERAGRITSVSMHSGTPISWQGL